jgi:hypothetical protein
VTYFPLSLFCLFKTDKDIDFYSGSGSERRRDLAERITIMNFEK